MTVLNLTIEDIEKTCEYHHTAWENGYVSRKVPYKVTSYKGRYGTGYKVMRPSWQTTRYRLIDYYILKDNKNNA